MVVCFLDVDGLFYKHIAAVVCTSSFLENDLSKLKSI